jgi:glycerol-3-phosphate dehydrogenase
MTTLHTPVLIIGAGATGAGVARDLALRGVASLVVEQADINAGASGANHGLLHSGCRYVSNDAHTARECHEESLRLKRLMPQCIEDTGGLFVAVAGDDEDYVARFPDLCRQCGIPVTPLAPAEARQMEPALSEHTIAAFQVPDASIDPFRLVIQHLDQAVELGARLLRYHRVVEMAPCRGAVRSVTLYDSKAQKTVTVQADQIVNAAGAWAGQVAALAGAGLPMRYSKGTLVVTHSRMTHRVINRLRPPGDGDILVPGGTVSILGTTSVTIDDLGQIWPTVSETDRIVAEGSRMVPSLARARFIRAYAGVRPLVDPRPRDGNDRQISRGFVLMDHGADGIANLATITGGKLSTFRIMARETADQVCRRLGIAAPSLTGSQPLPDPPQTAWSEPGRSSRIWLRQSRPDDRLLCECEMVSEKMVDEVLDRLRTRGVCPELHALAVRTRVGKGACQGAFCSLRLLAHLYQREAVSGAAGLGQLRRFFEERWKGQRPVLWDGQLAQAELSEALYCGLLGLEREGATAFEAWRSP